MIEIVIDPDFRDFFPPLDADVYEDLKEKIRYEGFTDPLKLWQAGDGNTYLLDGHHRYQICQELGIKPKAAYILCADKRSALDWIRRNQRARRNTSVFRTVEQYLAEKQAIAEQGKLNQQRALAKSLKNNEVPVVQNFGQREGALIESKGRTDEQIAKKAGTNPESVRQVGKVLDSPYEDIKEKARSGEMSINKAYREVKARDAVAKAPGKEEVPDWAKGIDLSEDTEDSTPTLEEIVEELQRENSLLQAQLESLQSDEKGLEIRKWQKIATNARREADSVKNRVAQQDRTIREWLPLMQYLYGEFGGGRPAQLLKELKRFVSAMKERGL